jgi:hypothetical protein
MCYPNKQIDELNGNEINNHKKAFANRKCFFFASEVECLLMN